MWWVMAVAQYIKIINVQINYKHKLFEWSTLWMSVKKEVALALNVIIFTIEISITILRFPVSACKFKGWDISIV